MTDDTELETLPPEPPAPVGDDDEDEDEIIPDVPNDPVPEDK